MSRRQNDLKNRGLRAAAATLLAAAGLSAGEVEQKPGKSCAGMAPVEAETAYAAVWSGIPKNRRGAPELEALDALSVDASACRGLAEPAWRDCASLRPSGLGKDTLRRRCLILYRFGIFARAVKRRPPAAGECRRFFEVARAPGYDGSAACRAMAENFSGGRMHELCKGEIPGPGHCLHWLADGPEDCAPISDSLSHRECLRNARIAASLRRDEPGLCGQDGAFCSALSAAEPSGVCEKEASRFKEEYCRREPYLRGLAGLDRRGPEER